MKLYRTILFAPGNRERMLQKVGKAGADAVVLDLEDAVPADEKDSTRAALGAAVETIAEEDGGGRLRARESAGRRDGFFHCLRP